MQISPGLKDQLDLRGDTGIMTELFNPIFFYKDLWYILLHSNYTHKFLLKLKSIQKTEALSVNSRLSCIKTRIRLKNSNILYLVGKITILISLINP